MEKRISRNRQKNTFASLGFASEAVGRNELSATDFFKYVPMIFDASARLLVPQATQLDVLTLVGYPIVDILNPLLHPKVEFEFIKDDAGGTDTIGFIITWKGEKQNWHHLYLPKELAKYFMENLISDKRRNPYFVVLMKDEDYTLLKEGFTEAELRSFTDGRQLKRGKRTKEDIAYYYRMGLTWDRFCSVSEENKPRVVIELPDSPLNLNEMVQVRIPESLRSKLPESERNKKVTARLLTVEDFEAFYRLHYRDNPHPSLKLTDFIAMNVGLFADDEPIAQAGNVAEAVFDFGGSRRHINLAGNLIVRRDWRGINLGEALSYYTRFNDFKRDPSSILIADNVLGTRDMWKKLYGQIPVVAKTAWEGIE